MSKVKLLLADDHEMMRSGLRALVERTTDMTIVGEAADGRTAVRMVGEVNPDAVVMDIIMPELNGVDATRQILDLHPSVRIICLTGRSDEQIMSTAMTAGALGFVRKESAFDELVTAVQSVMAGKSYVSPSLSEVLARSQENANGRGHAKLSGREREVLQLISEGKATKEVAHALHVSVKTVETHRANLMNKLNLFSVAELTKYAVREGMSTLE